MRSYYCYTHDIDNRFASCNVAVATFADAEPDALVESLLHAATTRFKALGYVLPRNATIRFVPDDRNVEDMAGYPPVREPSPRVSDSYAVASEYVHGETPLH
jgi:hypothetical protein